MLFSPRLVPPGLAARHVNNYEHCTTMKRRKTKNFPKYPFMMQKKRENFSSLDISSRGFTLIGLIMISFVRHFSLMCLKWRLEKMLRIMQLEFIEKSVLKGLVEL